MGHADLPYIEVDPSRRTVRVADRPTIVLRAKSFRLLEVLGDAAPDPISKELLLENVWPGRIVSEDSIVQCVRDIRRALGEKGPSLLQTVPGLGYRLRARLAGADVARRCDAVAVLPFELLGTGPRLAPFGYGLTSDLIYGLSRANVFRVLSPAIATPTEAVLGGAVRTLATRGARHVLTGTIQESGPMLRASAFLIETETEQVVWSHRWEDAEAVKLELQDTIVRETVNELANLWSGHVARLNAVGRQTLNMSAYDHFHAGVVAIGSFTTEGLLRGIDSLESAVTLDPSYGEAWASLSIAYGLLSTIESAEDVPGVVSGRERAARAAFGCRPLRGWAILCGAWLAALDGLGPRVVRTRIVEAVADQPYNADLLVAAAGHGAINSDLYDEAILWVDRAFEMNADAPNWYHWPKGYAQLFLGQPEAAVATLAQGPQAYPELLAFRAAAENLAGWTDAAMETRAELVRVHPGYSSAVYLASEPFVSERKRQRVERLFKDAGLPP